MIMASVEIIQFSIQDLYDGFAEGIIPEIDVGVYVYSILGTTSTRSHAVNCALQFHSQWSSIGIFIFADHTHELRWGHPCQVRMLSILPVV
jgi:hypothetical protein